MRPSGHGTLTLGTEGTVHGQSALRLRTGGGGAPHDTGLLVVELDGQRGVGDGDGYGVSGVGAAQGNLLAAVSSARIRSGRRAAVQV